MGDNVVVLKKLMASNAGEVVARLLGHEVDFVWEVFKERKIKLKKKELEFNI